MSENDENGAAQAPKTGRDDRHENLGPNARHRAPLRQRPEAALLASLATFLTALTASIVTPIVQQNHIDSANQSLSKKIEEKLEGTTTLLTDFKGDMKVEIAELRGEISGLKQAQSGLAELKIDLKAQITRLEERLHDLEVGKK